MAVDLRACEVGLQDAPAAIDEVEHERAVARLMADFAYLLEFTPGGPRGSWASAGLTRSTGYTLEEINALGWLEILAAEDRARVSAAWQQVIDGEADCVDVRMVTKSGRTRWLRKSLAPARSDLDDPNPYVLVAVQDITETRLAEESCQQADRMSALATLAAGVAHKINNPLHGLMLCASAAQQARQQGNDDLLDSCLSRMQQEAMRCGEVIRGLLQFAGEASSPYWPCKPSQLVIQACHASEPQAQRRRVKLRVVHPGDLPWVHGNPFELHYALSHLIGNAVEASPVGETVRVSAYRASDRVRFVVEDHGTGMDHAQLRRACDPFFTTHSGEGKLGLGLSHCYTIVRQHGGKLLLESHSGSGTRAIVELPTAPS